MILALFLIFNAIMCIGLIFKPSKSYSAMVLKFYKCEVCGNVIVKVVDSKNPVSCCGKTMTELVPSSTETLAEKHLPVIECCSSFNIKVCVSTILHPMTSEHYIHFICLETKHGCQVINLCPGHKPEAEFCISADKPVAVYEYCNLHGLWKTEINQHVCSI